MTCTKVPQNITLSPFQKNSVKVHEVKENLKLNLANNGSTVKCKYFEYIGRSLEYMYTDGFEFRSKLILIRLYRQHTGKKTYKLNTDHTNRI